MWLHVDTRDKQKYIKYSYYQNIFKKLSKHLKKEYNTFNFSKAAIKLYEITRKFNIIKKSSKKLTTYHLCELPGSFIYSLDTFINTDTKIEKWDWGAQSLLTSSGLKNNYYLAETYPEKWDFGSSGDGDITNISNINHYSNNKILKNSDIITSDCGIGDVGRSDFTNVIFASILTFLLGAKQKSHFIQKFYYPANNTMLSLIYICAYYFKNIYIYKPTVNLQSNELYIVMKNFSGVKDKDKKKLLKLYEKYDKLSIFKRRSVSLVKNIDEKWLNKINKIFIKYQNKMEDVIYKNITSMDYITILDKQDNIQKYHKKINKIINNKYNEWIKLFSFSKNKKNTFLRDIYREIT